MIPCCSASPALRNSIYSFTKLCIISNGSLSEKNLQLKLTSMAIVTGDRYLESLVKFVEKNAGGLIEGTLVLKLNPVGLHYVQSRLEALHELERLISGAPVDYLRAYVSDLGDHRALEQLRKIMCRLTSLKVVSVLPPPTRDPTPLSLLPFGRLKVLELRGCDLSTSAAKGLLELRHTLEKLICHNSTDALRHVFASRIADIKESPQWNRLSFVSCACNGLILMDESLQLLPAVETLDLSRNKFAKVDNLRKCTRLKHLDLGFNQLRSVASLSEVTSHILKLDLRSNALTTLRGIETLKSIEGLDISYNIISNYVELEVLSSLPSIKNLWLEGNPLCCARWYRPHVFSFFAHPEQVKLDDREMSSREFWKRQIIVARRHRRPASYGFYSPAREDNEEEGLANGKRKKLSRLACIESEEHGMNMFIEQDLLSCDNDIPDRDDNIVSDNEGELTSLINRIEFMKKERSRLWLEDFKDWMDQASVNVVDENKCEEAMLGFGKGKLAENTGWHIGETSRYSGYVSDSMIDSGEDRSTNILESNSSIAGSFAGNHVHQWLDSATENGEIKPGTVHMDLKNHLKYYLHEGENYMKRTDYFSNIADIKVQGVDKMNAGFSVMPPLTAVNSFNMSRSSSMPPGSPPHYQEDILHRRHYLEEDSLQLSAESISVASSDSDTSCDEDDEHEPLPPFSKIEQYMHAELLGREMNSQFWPLELFAEQVTDEVNGKEHSSEMSCDLPSGGINKQDIGTSEKEDVYLYKNSKRKPRKRVVLLSDDNSMCFHGDNVEDEHKQHTVTDIDSIGRSCGKLNQPPHDEVGGVLSMAKHSAPNDNIENYFNSCVADSSTHETCQQYIICSCILENRIDWRERQVAVILSSKRKLYLLLESGMLDGSGNSFCLLSSHKIEDVSEVVVGLGLQVVRVYIDKDATYLLITKSTKKTRHLLCMMGLMSHEAPTRCSLKSLDQVQLNLFDRQICGGLGITIYQYCMVLFSNNKNREEDWSSRSIFLNEGYLFVCIENIPQFSSLTPNGEAVSYFLLDSYCPIAYVSEMVVEAEEKQCVTLILKAGPREHCLSAVADTIKVKAGLSKENGAARAYRWKLKWFSAESLFEFVTLLKAIHAGITTSSISITYVS